MKKRFVLSCFSLSIVAICLGQYPVREWKDALKLPVDSVQALSLRKMKLNELPAELKRFTKLRSLDLGNNKLTSLPAFIADFTLLESIDLSKNKLDSFPEVLTQLPKLQKLILNRNHISLLPENLVRLQRLRYLDMWDNPLPDFPNALTQMPELKEFHIEGILYGPNFQEKWKKALPGVKLFFDPPCDCRE